VGCETIAIVGAGMSGLMAGRSLNASGFKVTVLEKSRGLGGRMATKRIEGMHFDHGAQFFTTSDPRFAAEAERWEASGIARRWAGGHAPRWTGLPGMTAVAKGLAGDLTVRREAKVTAAVRAESGQWHLEVENAEPERADLLVLSAPLPQALNLLNAGGVKLPSGVAEGLERIDYVPCIAAMVLLDGPSSAPAEGIRVEDGPIRWIADNALKPGRSGGNGALTILANSAYSRDNYTAEEAKVLADLLSWAEPQVGGRRIASATVHRWRYSEPEQTYGELCLWLPELNLGLCGDAFGGPRVEGAACSGWALADRIGAALRPLS
jgi:renalase